MAKRKVVYKRGSRPKQKTFDMIDRRTGTRSSITMTRAGELMLGGMAGALDLADQLEMPAVIRAMLVASIGLATEKVPIKSLLAVYHALGGKAEYDALLDRNTDGGIRARARSPIN